MRIVRILGTLPPIFYDYIGNHLASHGYAMITPYALSFNPSSNYEAKWLIDVDAWIQENLLEKMLHDGFHPNFEMDFENTFLAGHSSGAHVAGINSLYAKM